MRGAEIRQKFLKFFETRGHTIVPSSPLIPQNDPTLLFVNSGMVQFKDCFLGADKRPYVRATTCQKSLRISGKHNDLENVGMTARHHTFFEMLGNFSFGDYFKPDAIKFAWELVTKDLGISRDDLWVTIYEKDDEAGKLWTDLTDLLPGRVIRLGEKDNFWSMGEVGPCGPCTEIHVYRGEDKKAQTEELFRREDGSFLEIYNLVFMQYNRADGKLTPLPKPAVDTGMGLERVASVVNNVPANYDTDLLRDIITTCEKLSGFKYDGRSYVEHDLRKNLDYARDVAMRVIADHSRAASFLIAEGIQPGSEGRSYVLRRLLRRAIRHGRVLQFKDPFLAKTANTVIDIMGEQYPELRERKDFIQRVVDAEEKKFLETIDAGMTVLQKEVEKLPSGAEFPGKTAFLLHDTFGFPLDLTEDALKADGRKVNVAEFEREMTAQRTRSREDRKSQKLVFTSTKIDAPKTEFLGYKEVEADSTIEQVIPSDAGSVSLIVKATPFYAESGGQVGDTGLITGKNFKLKVLDTQKTQDKFFVHECEVLEGELLPAMKGEKAHLAIDAARRAMIRANHSATHLVHSGLRKFLGTHVKQAGSRVDENSLRFDYSHFEAVTSQQLREIENFVNEQIRSNHEVSTEIMDLEEARKTGAMALFGEKYGDKVRVVRIGPESLELCGGTHVSRSGDIGFLTTAYEGGIAAGTRRIEALSGLGAQAALLREREQMKKIAELLKTDPSDLDEKVEKALARTRALEKELETLKSKFAQSQSGEIASQMRTSPKGVKVIAQTVEGADTDQLRAMVDKLRVSLGSGVVVLGSTQGDAAIVVAGVTSDLTPGIHAGNLVKEAVKIGGGKGGGRPDFAQAGGVQSAKLHATLERVVELIS